MAEGTPDACSLGADQLGRRLELIAGLGESALIARRVEGGEHLLRFRGGGETRERLERLVAAESSASPPRGAARR